MLHELLIAYLLSKVFVPWWIVLIFPWRSVCSFADYKSQFCIFLCAKRLFARTLFIVFLIAIVVILAFKGKTSKHLLDHGDKALERIS